MNCGGAFFPRAEAQRWTIERPQANLISRLERLPIYDRLGIQKNSMPAATIHNMKLALLINNRRVVARDEGMPQYQVAVLQPPNGEGRMGNMDLFLAGLIDQQQSCGG